MIFSQKEYEYTMEGTHFSIDMITGSVIADRCMNWI